MKYISTRNPAHKVSAAQAIVSGIAPDGGLYVPEQIPRLTKSDFDKMLSMDYAERAAYILKLFCEEFTEAELLKACKAAYGRFAGDPAPVVKVDRRIFMLELWHGPTLAFKDMALTLMPHLLTLAKKKVGEKRDTLILVATSGDTGKAALEGYRDVPGIKIIVFFPSEGVSGMQKMQMLTQEGSNLNVVAVKGNFDECQAAVKAVFADKEAAETLAKHNLTLSSANSINWGRLVPQIAYYVSAYLDMLGEEQILEEDKINFCVPTGNFGNILAGRYAMQMGVPVEKLICASNANNVLSDFFNRGDYTVAGRKFHRTISPSMDILVSSNLERLLFEVSGRNGALTAQRMADLSEKGSYRITEKEMTAFKEFLYAQFVDEDDAIETMQDFFNDYEYPLDPHTGVAAGVYFKYRDEVAGTPAMRVKTVLVATANPYKFPQDVLFAITGDYSGDPFRASKKLYKETALEIPERILNLKAVPQRFKQTVTAADIKNTVLSWATGK